MRVFARDARQHAVDIGGEIALLRDHRLGAVGGNGDRIDEEAIFRIDRLIAGTQIGMGEELQDLVRARAADDVRRLETVARGDRLAQFMRRTVGIEFETLGGARDRPPMAAGLAPSGFSLADSLWTFWPLAPALPGT